MATTDTTAAELKSLYEDLVADIWEDGHLELVDEFVADDYVEHNPMAPEELHGPEGYRQNVEMLRAAFPDFEADIEDMVAEGDRVVARITNRGTFEGEFMGTPPNGNTFEAEAIEIIRFEDGKIAEAWFQMDALGFLSQLGIEGPPGEGA